MLRRIGFRHVLPPVQLALYCMLCFFGYVARQHQGTCTDYWSSSGSLVLAQEGVAAPFLPPCRAPKAWLAAGSLNLPAYFAGVILAAIFAVIFHRVSELWTFAISAPMIVLLWYWVGLWIDRKLGFVGLLKQRFRFPRVLMKAAQGFSVVMVFFSAIVMFGALLYHHQRLDGYLVGSSFLCWSVFLLEVTWSNARRRGSSETERGLSST